MTETCPFTGFLGCKCECALFCADSENCSLFEAAAALEKISLELGDISETLKQIRAERGSG